MRFLSKQPGTATSDSVSTLQSYNRNGCQTKKMASHNDNITCAICLIIRFQKSQMITLPVFADFESRQTCGFWQKMGLRGMPPFPIVRTYRKIQKLRYAICIIAYKQKFGTAAGNFRQPTATQDRKPSFRQQRMKRIVRIFRCRTANPTNYTN